jgi:hypothetical protein
VTFSLFWASKTHFRKGRHENKESSIFFFGLGILLPILIQLLDIENAHCAGPNVSEKKYWLPLL